MCMSFFAVRSPVALGFGAEAPLHPSRGTLPCQGEIFLLCGTYIDVRRGLAKGAEIAQRPYCRCSFDACRSQMRASERFAEQRIAHTVDARAYRLCNTV